MYLNPSILLLSLTKSNSLNLSFAKYSNLSNMFKKETYLEEKPYQNQCLTYYPKESLSNAKYLITKRSS